MSPTEYGIHLAEQEPPISQETAEAAARILASVEDVAA